MAKRGLDGVVAAQTRLSHVDGLAGELIIGGYQLKELAGRVSFEAAAHLLWRGALPSRDELKTLSKEIAGFRALPEETMHVVRAGAKAPPIDALRMACATMSLDLKQPDDISPVADMQAAKMLTARFPTVVAAHARLSAGKEPIAPRTDLSLAANFLYMIHGKEPDPIAARAIDTYWVTVIDHGMNASTFAGRVIASTRSDMVSAVTGAIGALDVRPRAGHARGHRHGGERRSVAAPGDRRRAPYHGIRSSRLQGARPARRRAGPGGGTDERSRAPRPGAVRSRARGGPDGVARARGGQAGTQPAHERRVLHRAGAPIVGAEA